MLSFWLTIKGRSLVKKSWDAETVSNINQFTQFTQFTQMITH